MLLPIRPPKRPGIVAIPPSAVASTYLKSSNNMYAKPVENAPNAEASEIITIRLGRLCFSMFITVCYTFIYTLLSTQFNK